MTVEYGFRDSSADAYRVEIGAIQAAIFDVLEAIDASVRELSQSWEGSESEMYQSIIAEWNSGAAGLTEVLTSVSEMLGGIQQANQQMRVPINELLDEQTN